MTNTNTDAIYRYSFVVPEQSLDENGHVNNVHFVQWMQDVAIRHYESMGGVQLTQTLGATWVVREHQITYLNPTFAGDEIEARTWVVNIRRVRSLRRYEFVRKSDGKTLVKGETDWVFVNAKSGRPMAIPNDVSKFIPIYPEKG
jgi:acyl-CoA thioester hydrolase